VKGIEGILFDFNGTLFWDSKLHEEAWREFALKHTGKHLSDDEMKQNVHGRINYDIVEYIFNEKLDKAQLENFSIAKELIYQQYLLDDSKLLILAPGAEELLCWLKEKNFPITIATSANQSNVDFYFRHLELGRWFDYSKVVFDDGTFNPKPAPDIFMRAADKIGLTPKQCLVVEDSLTGILSARNAQAGKILYVENDSPVGFEKVKGYIDGKIKSLNEIITFLSLD
jgi:beta-phosphoglucomutase-like phosphatase (HAD superfamily)